MAQAGKSVIISGGSSGIGKYLAGMYIDAGYSIAILDLNPGKELIAELKSRCGDLKQKVAVYRVDIRNSREVNKAVAKAVKEVGAPSRAINSAGVQRADVFEDADVEDFRFVVETNLFGSRNFASAVLPHMREGSQLAFVSSLAGITTNYTYSAYSSSKFGVVGLAGVLRIELRPKGIGVSVICPPEITTPMVEKSQKNIHPVTRELKYFAGSLTLDEACPAIYKGIEKGKFMIVPGFRAKFTYALNKYLPGFLLHSIVDGKVRKVMKNMSRA